MQHEAHQRVETVTILRLRHAVGSAVIRRTQDAIGGVLLLLVLWISASAAWATVDRIQRPLSVTVSFPGDDRVVFAYDADAKGSIRGITLYLATLSYTVPTDICAKFDEIHIETVKLIWSPGFNPPKTAPVFYVKFMATTKGDPMFWIQTVLLSFRNGRFSDALVTGPTGETMTWSSSTASQITT
jgi:hypothetical protein